MIKRINLNVIPFGKVLDTPKKEESDKKVATKPQEEKKHLANFRELTAVKAEIYRIEDVIAKTRENNPEADVTLLYQQLGKMINHQIDLEHTIERNISECLKK